MTEQAGIVTEDAANGADAEAAKPEPPADAEAEAAKPEPQAVVEAEPVKPEPPAVAAVDVLKPAPPPAAAADMPLLRIEAVVKKFGAFRAVDRLSLDIRSGEFFALLGPSGCGKTTLLRMLAGFETPDEGRILLDGKDIAQVLPHQRPVNMMFQSYALFPHLSVRDNIAFGLKRAGMARAEIAARVAEMVALVKLEGLEKRKPDQLSGGQKQRVALARSLARRPQVLLLDEPLAALDKKLRESTQLELMELQRRLGMTFIIVTHDQEEAMTVAGRIGVMDAGRLEQVATPRELYEAPASRWIAEFVGDVNLFDGEVETREDRRLVIATRDAGSIVVAEPRQPLTKTTVCIAIRPEKVKLSRRGPVSDAVNSHAINRLEGVVTDVGYLGGLTSYKVKLDTGAVLRSSMANTARLDIDAYSPGQRVVAWFTPDDGVVLEQ
jgi:putrescine transport system ATP-binding protein